MSDSRPKIEVIPFQPRDDSYLPQFPALAGFLDTHARRVPWWIWIVGGWALGNGLISRLFNKVKS
jgi:hypothetical protein